jgi:hypothetical protein
MDRDDIMIFALGVVVGAMVIIIIFTSGIGR